MSSPSTRNPHFDDGLVVWSDSYSGRYEPPDTGYGEQFDLQWKLAMNGRPGYLDTTGSSTEEDHIEDRIFEWTGKHPRGLLGFGRPSAGARVLDHPLDPKLIEGKECIDVGCGRGRWTKTMQKLGAASVLSVDMSESGLKNVAEFNPNVRRVDIMRLKEDHPDLLGKFDFANFWGVAMCTHDPLRAFLNAAATVKPGGALFLMVYCPTSLHGTRAINARRKYFYQRLRTVEDRVAYVDKVVNRGWDRVIPLRENIKNQVKNVLGRDRWDTLNTLDMLEPFYNWVIPLDVVEGWYRKAGFSRPIHLNDREPLKLKSAFHVLGYRKTEG